MKNILIPFGIAMVLIIAAFLMFPGIETFFSAMLDESRSEPLRYAGISFLVLSSDIILPVPSSVVMYTNGFVLGLGAGSVLSLVSLMVTCIIGYFAGLYGSYGLRRRPDREAAALIKKYGDMAILITRGIPVLSESVSLVCGFGRMNLARYLLVNVAGYAPLSLLYAAFGAYGHGRNMFLYSFGCSLLIAGIFWIIGRKYLTKPAPAEL
jgi:membrane protein DedA with SNARE-associated domain